MMNSTFQDFADYSLLEAMTLRRSRRFAMGMNMDGGALAYKSKHPPAPLTEDEEALLVFAASGFTGFALADLVYTPGKGDIMSHLLARTVASGDGAQAVSIFVINDQGTYLVRRPQELSQEELKVALEMIQKRAFTEAYRLMRVKIKDERSAPPLVPMYNLECNQWSVYQPGTTYILPVNDVTFLYINGLLNIFGPTMGAYVLDERHFMRSAGLKRFARSRGGHLDDDVQAHEIGTIQTMELGTAELIAIEQGMMHQNMSLVAQAMGIGGFPNFAVHPFGWFQAIGFRMNQMSTSRFFSESWLFALIARLFHKNLPFVYPVGLELGDQVLLKAYCPPYFSTMRDAVMAVVETKFGKQGTFRGGIVNSAFRDPSAISSTLPRLNDEAIEATISYCEYVLRTYKRFPAFVTPFRTVLGFQAAHLDVEFYDTFYKPEALSESHREHMARWHDK